jgi:signal transduction histidine kinase
VALLEIINDILDLSKVEAGKLTLESVPFELPATLAEVMQTLEVHAREKALALRAEMPEHVPLLLGDPTRLRQVLVNLVGNAIKFTDAGEVVVRVEVESAAPDGALVLHFAVSDTGIGISADKREVIFQAFTQADGSMTRRYGGTGLGLTIAAQLVAMMGGRIWVESQVGAGSVFHFTARLTARPSGESAAAPSRQASAADA